MNPLLHSAFSPIISSTVTEASCFKIPFKQNKLKNTYPDCLYIVCCPRMVLGTYFYLVTEKNSFGHFCKCLDMNFMELLLLIITHTSNCLKAQTQHLLSGPDLPCSDISTPQCSMKQGHSPNVLLQSFISDIFLTVCLELF